MILENNKSKKKNLKFQMHYTGIEFGSNYYGKSTFLFKIKIYPHIGFFLPILICLIYFNNFRFEFIFNWKMLA